MAKLLALFFSLSTTLLVTAQTIKVAPYLQDATPHSVCILWETLPALTRTVRFELKGTRNAGSDNDAYFMWIG